MADAADAAVVDVAVVDAAVVDAAVDAAVPVEGEPAEVKKPARGRPRDPNAPLKPKNAFQRVTGEARTRLKEEKPELATDLKAMAMALKDAWDAVPQEKKDQLQREYEEEMEVWRPKWAEYIQTPGYKKFFEVKQDWMDIKQKKILIKRHVKGKIEVGKKLRIKAKFVHEFAADPTQNYELAANQQGTVIAVGVGEDKNAMVDWDVLGEKTFLKKYFGKVQDPEIPKRPKSGYMIFAGDVREACQIEADADGTGLAGVGKKVAEKWAVLSETKKAEYGMMAGKMKEEFDKEFSVYRKTDKFKDFENKKVNLDVGQKLKKLSRTKLDDAPKKAPSASALFRTEVSPGLMKEAKEKGHVWARGELIKKVAELWEKVPEEEKAPYIAKSNKLRAQVEAKGKDFKKTKKYIGFLEERQKLKIRQNRLVNLRDMPKKPKSVFAMFATEHKEEVPAGKGEGKGVSALKVKFSEASEDEKKRLEAEQKELLEKWKQDVDTFKVGDQFKTYQTTETKVKREFMNEAMKVMTLKFLNAAPQQPPKSAFAIYLNEKRKATEAPEDEPKSKEVKREEVVKYQEEWKNLDKELKEEWDTKMKDMMKDWQAQVKGFCEDELWKEYLSEAKRLRVPIKSLLSNKSEVIKRLKNGMRFISLPSTPEEMPRKPPGAFKLYAKAQKKEKEISDLEKIGEMWKELDAEGKKPFEQEAEDLLKQFYEDMRLFRQSDEGKKFFRTKKQALRTRTVVKAKFTYLKGMPKPPMDALKMFMEKHMKEEKKANPELKGFEISKKLREKWLEMPEEEKKPLLDEADKKKEEYEAAMAEFKASEDFQKYTKAIRGSAKGKAKAKAAPQAGPKKPEGYPEKPQVAFREFCSEKKGCGMDVGALHRAWKEVPEEDRAAREAKVKEAEVAWKLALDDFDKTAAGKKYKREIAAYEKRNKLASARSRFLTDAPKKYSNAYTLFCAAKRETIATDFPDIKGQGPTMVKLGELWKNATAEDKQPFLEVEAASKKEYDEKMLEFHNSPNYKKFKAAERSATGRPSAKGKGKAVAKSSGPAAPEKPEGLPKKPLMAMLLFKVENKGPLKEINQKWIELGAAGQAEWNKRAKENQEQYEKDLKVFKTTDDGKKYFKLLGAFEKKGKESKVRERILGQETDMPKEPKRPQTAYFMFLGEKRKDLPPGLSGPEAAKQLAEFWNKLEPDDKKVWEDKAAETKKEHEKAVEEYKNDPRVKKLDKALKAVKGGGKPKKKAKVVKAKQSAKPTKSAPKKAAGSAAAGKGAAKAKAKAKDGKSDSDSDSDAMGSDSSNNSSSDDSDSD